MASIETEEAVHAINSKSNPGTARKHDWGKGGLFCDFENFDYFIRELTDPLRKVIQSSPV
jgi:hypothetical protein